MAPMRRRRRPRATRQTPANQARSFSNTSESGASVCSVVSEYGIPYCVRLLQADILPQKLSRRCAIPILAGVSGVAWISTGTDSPAQRRVLAMARSSPKFGSVTMTPSISAACFLKRSAHKCASASDSMAPWRVSSGFTTTAWWPAFSSAAIISVRPLWARWPGKNPRLPTMTPNVIFPLVIT